ncbi:Lrp/AsnC family transcriptional regulator [Natrialba swarupiae]|uniref:Lrp/AsnC family transcriptional regulator n=1 Tax=Natrialba swarupiae TaxID=2448032 RepID=A0A5D5AGT5_9EURY|nr:Lrp/AsnC family transcriptional regulator [Natrialba swarupiae]TYT60334.1 Lrp/AsnC family transcriptional regulator [Natrialba swarupiae]
MNSDKLDETDRGILHLLQEDARNYSAADIAEEVGVTANTVRNRISRLQERGVIDGYVPLLNYEQAGYQLTVIMCCTAPIPKRRTLAQRAGTIDGVTQVREVMTGHQNVQVIAVASESEKITEIANRLHELGLKVESEELVKNEYVQPFGNFDKNTVEE